ncbi:MAG TPA: endonuclease [Microscillaceae bacterium]|nr:endonuclease [Microscillaceae bacterium]
MKDHNYFVYITTNPGRTVLYTGVTNDLLTRIRQHEENEGNRKTFTGRYFCYNLVYWEHFQFVEDAIAKEKQLKGWSRAKKEALINETNPQWIFLNDEIE